MKTSELTTLEFILNWQSEYANHKDRSFVQNIDFDQDHFPINLRQAISSLEIGETYSEILNEGILVPPF